MSPTIDSEITFEDARDLINDDSRLAVLPTLAGAAASRWQIEDPEINDQVRALLVQLVQDLGGGARPVEDVTAEELTRWCTADEDHLESYERRSAVHIARSALEATSSHMLGPEDLTIELPVLVEGQRRRPLMRIERASVRAATHRVRSGLRDGHANRLRRSVIALAEAGGTTNEIPQVTYEDIRRGNAKVTFVGTRDTCRREVELTKWGRIQIYEALDHLEPGQKIAYQGAERGQGPSSAASVSGVAKRVLRDAGLIDKDITPDSLRKTAALDAWNGREIEPVVDRLGLTTKNRVQTAWEVVHFFDDMPS